MDRVALHVLGERYQLKIAEFTVGAVAILEADDVSRRNRPVMLLPDVAIEQRPDFHIAESVGLALRSLAYLDPKKALTVGEDGADRTPVLRRYP